MLVAILSWLSQTSLVPSQGRQLESLKLDVFRHLLEMAITILDFIKDLDKANLHLTHNNYKLKWMDRY